MVGDDPRAVVAAVLLAVRTLLGHPILLDDVGDAVQQHPHSTGLVEAVLRILARGGGLKVFARPVHMQADSGAEQQ